MRGGQRPKIRPFWYGHPSLSVIIIRIIVKIIIDIDMIITSSPLNKAETLSIEVWEVVAAPVPTLLPALSIVLENYFKYYKFIYSIFIFYIHILYSIFYISILISYSLLYNILYCPNPSPPALSIVLENGEIARAIQSCKNVPTVPTSWCYFFWPVLIFGKMHAKNRRKHAKTGENTQKQAKNRRFFGANVFGGKIGRC